MAVTSWETKAYAGKPACGRPRMIIGVAPFLPCMAMPWVARGDTSVSMERIGHKREWREGGSLFQVDPCLRGSGNQGDRGG